MQNDASFIWWCTQAAVSAAATPRLTRPSAEKLGCGPMMIPVVGHGG